MVITGGGTGIGAETARSFAEAGASRIALLGRREQPLLDTKASIAERFPQVEVWVSSTDVTKKLEVDKTFEKFTGDWRIDVLVSNAAIMGPQESVRDVDPEKLLAATQQNLRGTLHIAQAFLRHASKNAVAINVSSSGAHLNVAPLFASYCISKAAMARLWDSLAYANPEICVFHVQPGVVNTDMNKEVGGVELVGNEDHASDFMSYSTQYREADFDLVSLPASFHVWLASSEARFLKSKFVWANWDVDELKDQAKEIEDGKFSIGLSGWPFHKRT